MQIKINQEPIDFKLSENITLGEVLKCIQSWAEKKDLFILNYKLSPKDEPASQAGENILSSEINLLDVEVGTQSDLYRDSLQELNSYVDRMGFFLASKVQEGKNLSESEEVTIREGLEWIIESVSRIMRQLNVAFQEKAKGYLSVLEEFKNKDHIDLLNEEEQIPFLDNLAGIKNQALIWYKACQYHGVTQKELKQLLEELKQETLKVLESLEEIAADLTAGKEAAALQKIEDLASFISDMLSLLYQTTVHEKERSQLVHVLDQLMSALSKGDLVTAADLVDYEIREALEKITFLTNQELSN